jgi:hypothetical protein
MVDIGEKLMNFQRWSFGGRQDNGEHGDEKCSAYNIENTVCT